MFLKNLVLKPTDRQKNVNIVLEKAGIHGGSRGLRKLSKHLYRAITWHGMLKPEKNEESGLGWEGWGGWSFCCEDSQSE